MVLPIHKAVQCFHRQLHKVCRKQPTVKNGLKSTLKTLELIKENPLITIPELATALNKSKSAIEKQIAKLKENQQLERIGPDKGGYWQVLNKKIQN